jgi:hypothetical protein
VYCEFLNTNKSEVLMKTLALRILATFAASGLGVIGAGAVANVPIWKAVLMAGIGGVATVIEGLSRAYLDDGKLSVAEINAVFDKVETTDAE